MNAMDGLVQLIQEAGHPDDLIAKHERLTQALRVSVRQGLLRPGAAIPGERALAERLDMSRTTVRRAIKTLVDERLLVQRPGARTSVAQRVEKPVSLFAGFSQDMRARGLRPGSIWLARETGPALSAEAFELSLSPGAPVCRLKRLRTADDVLMALETSIVPVRFLPDPAMVDGSLYAALEKRGTVPVRALQRMRATVAGRAEAEQLGIEPGAPLLDMERRCFNQAGEAVEFCHSLYRGDLYDLLVELS